MTLSLFSVHALGKGSPKPNAQVTGYLNAFEMGILSKRLQGGSIVLFACGLGRIESFPMTQFCFLRKDKTMNSEK